MIDEGKAYFFIAHSYHHYLGEVVEVGHRYVKLKHCCKVMADNRGWEKLLFDGCSNATQLQHVPDGTLVPLGLPIHPWHHVLPRRATK